MPSFSLSKAPSRDLPCQADWHTPWEINPSLCFVGMNRTWKAVCVCERHNGCATGKAPSWTWCLWRLRPSPGSHRPGPALPQCCIPAMSCWNSILNGWILFPYLYSLGLWRPARGYNPFEGGRQEARGGPASGCPRGPNQGDFLHDPLSCVCC